jgi:Cu2+-exporting ATPase
MPAFAVIVFLSGGVPFQRVDLPESRDRSPGMMTPISMASSVAFVYSVGTVMVDRGEPLF